MSRSNCHCPLGDSNPVDSTWDPSLLLPSQAGTSWAAPRLLLAVWETTVGGQPSSCRMALPRMEECFYSGSTFSFFPVVKLLVNQRGSFSYARLPAGQESLVSLETKLCPPKCLQCWLPCDTHACRGHCVRVHAASPQRGTSLRNVLVSRISKGCRSRVSGACLEYRWCWIWFKMFKWNFCLKCLRASQIEELAFR